jgi:hypothetical protein
MKRTEAVFSLLVVVVQFLFLAFLVGSLVKLVLFDFFAFIKGFLGFGFIVGCLIGVLIVGTFFFTKIVEFLELINEKSKQEIQSSWHYKHSTLIFFSVLFSTLIYAVIDEGLGNSINRIGDVFSSFQSLNSHIKISIILYEMTLGLALGVVLNFFKEALFKDKPLEDIKEDYATLGVIGKVAIPFALMILLSLDLMVSDAALQKFRFTEQGKFLLANIALVVAYIYLKKQDGVDLNEKQNKNAFVVISLLTLAYLMISPSSVEHHYSSIREALTERREDELQKKLKESLKKVAYDSIVLTERELMTEVQPYRYLPTVDAKGNFEIKVKYECIPQAIYLYSSFTNSNYYDLIKDEVANLERLSSYTDEDKQACFKELNTVSVQRRSQVIKSVLINACNQRLIG